MTQSRSRLGEAASFGPASSCRRRAACAPSPCARPSRAVRRRSWPWLAGRCGLSAERVGRRALMLATLGAAGLSALPARARGRLPVGGRVSLRLPWPLTSIDPHRLDDGTAAILGASLFDSLYAPGEGGAVVPALAEGDPVVSGDAVRVVVREGLRTAAGRLIGARDVMLSLSRGRSVRRRGSVHCHRPSSRIEERCALRRRTSPWWRERLPRH